MHACKYYVLWDVPSLNFFSLYILVVIHFFVIHFFVTHIFSLLFVFFFLIFFTHKDGSSIDGSSIDGSCCSSMNSASLLRNAGMSLWPKLRGRPIILNSAYAQVNTPQALPSICWGTVTAKSFNSHSGKSVVTLNCLCSCFKYANTSFISVCAVRLLAAVAIELLCSIWCRTKSTWMLV